MMRPEDTFVSQSARSLQTMLRLLSEADQDHPTVIPDGIFGKQTQNAVTYFQRKYRLPVTGIADQATWERLVPEAERARIEVHPAQPLQIILNPGKTITKGESSYHVYLVQVMLMALAEVYGAMMAPAMTGILDDQTSEALIFFQYLNDLPQTGHVDKKTWRHLALQYPLAVNHKESENMTNRTVHEKF